MADQIPDWKGDPNSAAWFRWAQARIQHLEREAERRRGGELNANKGQNATIETLSAQMEGLATVEALTQVATDLAETAADVAETAWASRVYPAVASSSASNFPLSTGGGTVVSTSISVPDGYTRALVTAVAGVSGASGSGSGDRLAAQAIIGGSTGPAIVQVLLVDAFIGSVAPSHAATLTGLSGGSIAISVYASLQTGPNNALFQPYNSATLTATALFLP